METGEGAAVCDRCGAVDTETSGTATTAPVIAPPDSILPDLAHPFVPSTVTSIGNDPPDIGGWLILVAIRLFVSPFLLLYTIFKWNVPFIFGGKYQTYLAGHPMNAVLILFELTSNTILFIGLIYLNVLFLRKKKTFPRFMIAFIATQFCISLVDVLRTRSLHPTINLASEWRPMLGAVASMIIWIPYFLRSTRVKITFVR
jgi:hypothetical protein